MIYINNLQAKKNNHLLFFYLQLYIFIRTNRSYK